ncbi:MAG: hypothetical protein KZQ95_01925 [Candidatus Thiodiazotropha sp. (ex Epidulcina cf. delphinae)]|nr:hypothetical protein [Candidatus Thiodiazotropha sp. (ex Epidulcina cf. delphinae)]
MTTDVSQFISDLDAGIFEEKVSAILSEVAGAVIDISEHKLGVTGKVSLEFTIGRIGSSYQVQVDHTLKYARPTLHGKKSEENKKSTPMHVGKGGRMTFFPEDQSQLFTKTGDPATKPENQNG